MSFCLRYVNDEEDICKDFVKFIHCKSGLTGKYLYNGVTEALASIGLDLRKCRGKVILMLVLFLVMLMDFQP